MGSDFESEYQPRRGCMLIAGGTERKENTRWVFLATGPACRGECGAKPTSGGVTPGRVTLRIQRRTAKCPGAENHISGAVGDVWWERRDIATGLMVDKIWKICSREFGMRETRNSRFPGFQVLLIIQEAILKCSYSSLSSLADFVLTFVKLCGSDNYVTPQRIHKVIHEGIHRSFDTVPVRSIKHFNMNVTMEIIETEVCIKHLRERIVK